MKKILIFVILLTIAPFVTAITTNMAQTYQPGETMIIKIQGNILQPITPANILFKRAHVAIAVIYDVKRIGTDYYLYAQLPLQPNNYSLFINDVATTVNGVVTTIDFSQSFSVVGNIIDYSISPGFAIVSNTLALNLILNLDQPTTINLNFPEEQAFTLQPGTNTITLSTSSAAPGIYQATVGRYTLPIQVINTSAPANQRVINNNVSIQITPQAIRAITLENNQASYIFSILNTGENTLENLLLSYNTNLINITPYFISSLQPNSSQQFNLSISRLSGSPILTEIIVQIGSYNKSVPINISFTANANQTTQINDTTPQYYCSELGGRPCAASETCSTDPVQTLDGSCCTGTCETESSGGFGWIGYISIAAIILVIIIIYFYYKKSSIPKPRDLTSPPPRAMPSPPENKIQLPPGFPSRQPVK